MAESNPDGATSLRAMMEGQSTSATPRIRAGQSGSVPVGTPSDFRDMLISPGDFSYGSYGTKSASGTETGTKSKTLKQARGTGRKIGASPNKRSYTELAKSVENIPGAEIRVVTSSERKIPDDQRHRLKLYNSLQKYAKKATETENRRRASVIREEEGEATPLLGHSISNAAEGFLEYPIHLLPANFFQVHIPGVDDDAQETQSSFVTILSIWNTMMGTSLLAVPWAMQQSGLAVSLVIMLVMTFISLYTATIIIDLYAKHNSQERPVIEFSMLCGILLNPFWERVCSVFSLLAVLGAAIVYTVLMSTFLYNTGSYFIDLAYGSYGNNMTSSNASVTDVICPSRPNANDMFISNISTIYDNVTMPDVNVEDHVITFFTKKIAPTFLIVLLPMIGFKNPTIFTKFNSVGTLNVFFLIGVVFYLGFSWGFNFDFQDDSSDFFVPMFKPSFPALSGMMALGLFLHNAVITILKNNRHQENNRRDLTAGFTLVSGTYTMIGLLYYLAFPMAKSCIEDNFLNNFHGNNPLMVVVRIMLLLQMITVFPLIMYILRCQFFYLFSRNEEVGYVKIYLVNAAVMTIGILFAILMPSIGNIIRFSGALCGAVVVFVLPPMVYLASKRKERKLTVTNVSFHVGIICIGIINFGAQFFV